MPRHPGNLFPLLQSQAPHLLEVVNCATYMEFIELCCDYEFRKIPGSGPYSPPRLHVSGAKDAALVHRLLTQPYLGQPAFMLRRTEGSAGISLPSLWWQWQRVSVNTSLLDQTIKSLPDGIKSRLLSMPDKLANDPMATMVRHALGVAKADAYLPTLCEELIDGSQCVVIAHHKTVMDMCETAFRAAGVSWVRVGGDTTPQERVARMRQFQSGSAQIFLGSLLAVQTGITLTSASRIVILEPGWTGDSNVQVVKRIHRISQTQPCRAQLLVAAGTLEEAVMKQVEAEITMAHTVVDGGTRPDRDEHLEW